MEGNKTKEVSDWGEEVTTSAPKEVSDWGEDVTTEPLKKKEFSGESLQPYQAATQPSGLSSLSEAKINVPEGERGIEQPKAEVEHVKKEELTQYNILPNQKLTGDKLYTTNPKSGVTTFKTLSKDELEKYRQAAQPKSGFQEFAQTKIEAEKQRVAELPKKEKEPTADDLKQRVIELDNLSAKNIDEIKNIDIQLGIISNKQQSLKGMPRLMYASQEANKLFAEQIALKKQRDMLVMKQQAYDTKASEAMGLLTNQETQRLVEESNTPFWGTFINGIKTNAEEIKDAIPYIKDIIDIGAQTTGVIPTDYNSMFSKMVANKDLRKNELEKAYVGYKATAEAEKRVEGAGLTDNLPLYKFRKYAGHVFGGMTLPAIGSAGVAAMTGGTSALIPLTNASIFGIMGLGSGALNTYFIARENGLSPDDAIIASERGALIGLTVQAGLGLTMGKAGHFLNSKFNTAIKPLTATAVKLGLESIGTGTEMAGAKFVENVATGAATALPMKPTEGLGESFLEGMLFHATAHFGGVPSYLKSKSLFRAVDKVKTPEGISRMRKQIVDSNKSGLINNTQMVQLTKQLDDAIDFGKYIPEDITDEEIRDRFFDTLTKYDEYNKLKIQSPNALKSYYERKLSELDNVIDDLIAKQKELNTLKQQQYEKATKTGERPSLDTRNAKPIEEVALTDINKGDVIIGYHSTPTGDIDTGGELGIHIGTKEVAENINKGKRDGKGEVKRLAFKPKRPLILGDMPSWSSINVLNELLRQKFTGIDKEKLQEIRDSDLSEKEKQRSIIDLIKGQGYDSVVYQNFDEGNGEYSYILFDKSQLEEQGETPAEPTKTFEQKVEETAKALDSVENKSKSKGELKGTKVVGEALVEIDAEQNTSEIIGLSQKISEAFNKAGEQSKIEQSPKALGEWLIKNAQTGDKIVVNEDEYWLVERKTDKKGNTEIELQQYFRNEKNEFENNPSAVKLFNSKHLGTETAKLATKDASDLFENRYRNSSGEVVVERSKYIPQSKNSKSISEAYHADKAAGKETEFTKAVEELIGKPQEYEKATKAGEQLPVKTSGKPTGNYEIAREATAEVSKENPDASVLLIPKGEDLSLAAVYVGKEKRGKGIGTKVLESAKRQADRLGKKIFVDATTELDEETDLERLGKFYERNGFAKVGENKYEYSPQAKPAQAEPKKTLILQQLEAKHPDTSFYFDETDNDISLSALYVGESKRSKGEGSRFLSDLKDYSDKTGKPIKVTATDEFGGDVKRLAKFYLSNGFEKVGENKYEYSPQAKPAKAEPTKTFEQGAEEGKGVWGEVDMSNIDFDALMKPKTEEEKQKIKDEALEEEYQNSKFDKRWAKTYKEAKQKLIEQYNKAKAEKEKWENKKYKSAGSASVEVGDELSGGNIKIDYINKKRRERAIKNAQSEMDSAKNDLLSLGLSKKEVEELIGKPQQYEKAKEDGEPMPKGVSGVRAEGEGGKESAELRAKEEEVANEIKITKNEAAKSKSASPRRTRKSKDITKSIEAEAKNVEDSRDAARAEELIQTIETAENAILNNAETNEDFEKKYGFSELSFADEYNSKGKQADLYDTYKTLTGKELDLEGNSSRPSEKAKLFAQDLLSALSKEGIKLKTPLNIDGLVVKVEPVSVKAYNKKGVDALQKVVSKDVLKPHFQSVYFDGENMVATDGSILTVQKKTETDKQIIQKAKEAYVKSLEKTLGKKLAQEKANEDYSKLEKNGLDGILIDFKTGQIVDAKYPDYKSVIPKENKIVTQNINIQELINLANGAELALSNNNKDIVPMVFKLTNEDGLEIGVSARLLKDLLQSLQGNGSKNIILEFDSPSRAIVVKSDNGDIGLIMPMLVSEETKNRSNEILLSTKNKGEAKPKPAQPTANQKLISDAIDITKEIANPKTNAPERKLLKEKMNEMLSTNPKIKYIFDNIEKIEKELSANLKDDFKKKGDC